LPWAFHVERWVKQFLRSGQHQRFIPRQRVGQEPLALNLHAVWPAKPEQVDFDLRLKAAAEYAQPLGPNNRRPDSPTSRKPPARTSAVYAPAWRCR
jgi:hypothetical protein